MPLVYGSNLIHFLKESTLIQLTLSVLPQIARSCVDGRPIRITCDMDQHVILSSVRRALANDISKSCLETRTTFKLEICNSSLLHTSYNLRCVIYRSLLYFFHHDIHIPTLHLLILHHRQFLEETLQPMLITKTFIPDSASSSR